VGQSFSGCLLHYFEENIDMGRGHGIDFNVDGVRKAGRGFETTDGKDSCDNLQTLYYITNIPVTNSVRMSDCSS